MDACDADLGTAVDGAADGAVDGAANDAVDLIAFGQLFLELVFGHVPRLPGPGEEIFTDEFAISCGGSVTIATAARAAGARAGISSLLGDDLGSRVAEQHCIARGIDLRASRRVTGSTAGITVVLNFSGERSFVSHVPSRPGGEPPELDRWHRVLDEHRPSWCYVHAGPGVADLLRHAHDVGTRVALDLSFGSIEKDREAVVDCAGLADVFLPNEAELARLTGARDVDASLEIASAWCRTLVVTRGPAGASLVRDGHAQLVAEGVHEVEVRDRTGAGDSFAGALVGALVAGSTLLDAVAAGNAAGSDAVGRLGAVGEVEVEGLSRSPGALSGLVATVLGGAGPARASSRGAPLEGPYDVKENLR